MKQIKHFILLALLMSLASVEVKAYDALIDGIYYNFSGTEATVTYATTSYNSYRTAYIRIPEKVTYSGETYTVSAIGVRAFQNCTSLEVVIIPNSVTSIGMCAFSYCTGLKSAEIPSSVTSIEYGTFESCTGLTSVNIPNSVTTIGQGAFNKCAGLASIKIPNSVTSIGKNAFSECTGLTSVEIGNSVTIIDGWAFQSCTGLTSVKIPNSVTSIYGEAFEDCKGLTSIEIPNSVTTIGNSAFRGCTGLTSITIDGGNKVYDSRDNCNAIIETASNTLIYGCKSTIIPSSVTEIDYGAFQDCTELTSIEIPNSVASIGGYAFYGCTGLTSIIIGSGVTTFNSNCFVFTPTSDLVIYSLQKYPYNIANDVFSYAIDSNAQLKVPTGSGSYYKGCAGWKNFSNISEFEPTGIETVDAATEKVDIREVYDLSGSEQTELQRGLNIVRMSDGTVKKVMVK